MESFKQKRANLLNDNPIASHGSWISKHSIAAGSPLHQGGSGKSPLHQDKRSGFQPNRARVELNDTTRLTWDGGVLRDRKSGGVVIGGSEDSSGTFIPKTAEQVASDWDQDPRNKKGSEAKKRFKASKEKEFNKPENVAKRKANKAKMDAKKAAAKQTTKTEAVTETRDTRSNTEKKQAAVDAKKAQSAKAKVDILASRAEKKKIKASKNT
jgi:hypothetical protein